MQEKWKEFICDLCEAKKNDVEEKEYEVLRLRMVESLAVLHTHTHTHKYF